MSRLDLKEKWVLVTGASSGLGKQMALHLAKDHGANVILVARRAALLEEVAQEIRGQGKQAHVITADLATKDGPERVFTDAVNGREVHAVVLNAGITFSGLDVDHEHEHFERMLATNVTSQVLLSRRFVRHFQEQKVKGGLLLVSSIAGLAPMPYQAAYAGTKAFLVQFGRSLFHEVRRHGISVTVFLPGGIATDMFDVAARGKFKRDDFGIMPADVCARSAVKALVRRHEHHAPGVVYKLAQLLLKLSPHSIAGRVIFRIYDTGPQKLEPSEPRQLNASS